MRVFFIGLFLLCSGLWVAPRAAGAAASQPATENAPSIRISKHAAARMAERGVKKEDVWRILSKVAPFDYIRHGRREQGYYEPDTRIFLATADGVLITVITGATPRYVERMKRTAQ